MDITVHPSLLSGEVTPPSSKSVFQRLVAGSLLSNGTSHIGNPAYCDDGLASVGMAASLGAEIEEDENMLHIQGGLKVRNPELSAGESGLGIRLFTPIAALSGESITINGSGTLAGRPLGIFEHILPQLGVQVKTNNGSIPLHLHGKLHGASIQLDGSLTSQVISGLLMALPLCKEDSRLEILNPTSTPYLEMTLEVIESFGVHIEREDDWTFVIPGNQVYEPIDIDCDADWSAAAFLLVAGAIAGEGRYQVNNLDGVFTQADHAVTGPLLFSGTRMKNQAGDYQVVNHMIRGFEFDATDCPDLFPPLAALAAFADKPSIITGVNRLVHKESNRAKAIQEEFGAAGIPVALEGDNMIITPADVVPCSFNSRGDHRMAMAGALLAIGGAPILIKNADAVSKSYPGFFDDLIGLGAEMG